MSDITSYTLINTQGMEVTLLDFGARVGSILFPIKGELTEMTLGYDEHDDYYHDEFYLGASVGRVCNRIANGNFTLNKQRYQLKQNSGRHCLHGGGVGFSHRAWQANLETMTTNSIEFTLKSLDGDQGFPAELIAKVNYELLDNNSLRIKFEAVSDKDTLVNLCNHCYFHLGEQSLNNLSLQLNAQHYLPTDGSDIPTGKIEPVTGSDFCFNQRSSLGKRLTQATDTQIRLANHGFDHCYVLDKKVEETPVAILVGETTGVQLSIYTDQVGMQLYTGQYLAGKFKAYSAVCLEAQNFPDAINHERFDSGILLAGEIYQHETCYHFC